MTLHERSAEEVDSPTSESGRNENRRKIHQLQQEKEALQQQVESLSHGTALCMSGMDCNNYGNGYMRPTL